MDGNRIRTAVVLGAGTMGSRIAAHFANAGIPCLLLDTTPSELAEAESARGLSLDAPVVRRRIVEAGWRSALAAKPAALFTPELADLVTRGTFSDDLARVSEADWIVEAVTERLEAKRALFDQVSRLRRPGSIVSSNTSGIPIRRLAEGYPEEFRRHFLGAHFFNPPRQIRLLEIIPLPETDPEVVALLSGFAEEGLGKGVVVCRDTPGFIANRIGTFGVCVALSAMAEYGLTVEEVDTLTGPLIGRPRSGTFRTLDIVGLDTFAQVATSIRAALPEGMEESALSLPWFVETLVKQGRLGEKTGKGFYRRSRDGAEIEVLDLSTLEYRPLEKPVARLTETALGRGRLTDRLRFLLGSRGREAEFLWQILCATLWHAASCAQEISDDIVSVDRAIKWGFRHELGPFETWDAVGVEAVADRMARSGLHLPELVRSLLSAGHRKFYRRIGGRPHHFALTDASYSRTPERAGLLLLSNLKERKRTIIENAGASLIDIGDGVACLEFHTKMNTIDADVLEMMNRSLDEVERCFVGLVVANEGENFCAGANLAEILGAARAARWDDLGARVRAFQRANMRLRHSDKPVAVAPHNLALGGGCETALHADRIHAAAELYIGFVEVSVGLIPAGGGCKEMIARAAGPAGPEADNDSLPRIRSVFELIGTARVSGSALEALRMGILRPTDGISMNAEHRISRAKEDVLALARRGYRASRAGNALPVLGEPGFAALKLGLHLSERGGKISEYDRLVGTRLAHVLTAGSLPAARKVDEQYILDLESEAFLSLCGDPRTQARIEHMLNTGRPLRN